MKKDLSPSQGETDPRIYFAAERTLLAWIRTGLSMMGFGFVVARFGLFLRELWAQSSPTPPPHRLSLWVGTALVALGVAVNLASVLLYIKTLRQLKRDEWVRPSEYSLGVVTGIVLALLGLAMSAYLLTFRR